MKVCAYLMTDLALHMEVEDGANATVQEFVQAIVCDEQLRIPRTAANMFTLWMSSGLLELQLKPHHKPLAVRAKWPALLAKYAHASESRQRRDEPVLTFQRNVFYHKSQEERIKDEKILELLYAEAKNNILEGRYPCEVSHYIMLGSIQARIELGPYNPQVHTLHFFREQHGRFLPVHLRNGSWSSWLRLSSKDSPEVRLLEHYKRLPERKLQRKYLEFCWSLPYYGSAFFQGQIEQPVRGLTSLITHQDIPVLVAINSQGVYVINNVQCAVMMDTLITGFVEELKQKVNSADEPERPPVFETNSENDDGQLPLGSTIRRDLLPSFLGNKLSKLTLATFDEEGRCIGQMGSWSFSY
ncbi:hypothetical protein AAG570_007946 [Ranatra chinensis]|uniref:FERM domain-containing protein 8 n=1 Tax=Ranatra chinensis TaxID=642074 RepID=A0ABD0XVA0_9HEMI